MNHRKSTTYAVTCLLALLSFGCKEAPKPPAANQGDGPPEMTRAPEDPEAAAALRADKIKSEETFVPRPVAEAEDDNKKQNTGEAPSTTDKQDSEKKDFSKATSARSRKSGKGNYGPGLITTPLSAHFSAKEQINQIQIDNNLKNFNALHSRPPRDFEEFKKEIIEPSGLTLPELREGERFGFDPKRGPHGEAVIIKSETLKE